VKNGEVTGFDAGVFVDGGSANTLTHLNVHDNLSAPDPASFLGDGIVLMHSSDNTIAGNTVAHNGNFDGIGVLGLGSNNNTIRDNAVQRNTDLGTTNFGSGSGIIVDAFLEVEDPNRGQSLSGNDVIGNLVKDNVAAGISSISNVGGHIVGNRVIHNGYRPDGTPGVPSGNGIGIQANQGASPTTGNVVSGNTVSRNYSTGIQVAQADANQITRNHVGNSGNFGIESLFGHSNSFTDNVALGDNSFDLEDLSGTIEPCDSDVWSANTYSTADPPCAANGGHQVTPPQGAAAQAAPAAVPAPTAPRIPSARGRSLAPPGPPSPTKG
jgi:parallel beta-helix repeat protein